MNKRCIPISIFIIIHEIDEEEKKEILNELGYMVEEYDLIGNSKNTFKGFLEDLIEYFRNF